MASKSIERGLLPLLDISVLLLGFFLVLMAASQAEKDKNSSVFAGESLVLIELAPEEGSDAFLLYETDENGQRKKSGSPLEDVKSVVKSALENVDSYSNENRNIVVVVQFSDVLKAEKWTPEHMIDLRNNLKEYKLVMLWGK